MTKSGTYAETTRFETPLPVPRLVEAKSNGNELSLTIAQGTLAYRPGQPVNSFGYSAQVLGPAIRLTCGDTTNITIQNNMDRATTVHWHGLVIPGEVDGGPHNTIVAGQRWRASLRVDQPETTAWFHPHLHAETARQVYSGLAGILIVEDGSGQRLGLPRSYGVDDIPLVLQDRTLDRSRIPVYQPGPMDIMTGYRGDTTIVNGTVTPLALVPAGLVRLRLLNGANARLFDLRFSDGRSFHVIASDGGYLASPVGLQSLQIAPGERYEVLVDFANGADAVLETGDDNNAPMMGMMRGGAPSARGGSVMKFQVDTARPAAVMSLPEKLVDVPSLDRSKAVAHRQLLLNDMMMGGRMGGMSGETGSAMAINGQSFDLKRIDVETKRGKMELWEIGSR